MRTLAAASIVASACNGSPTPRVHQIEQGVEATPGGGERYRAPRRSIEVAEAPGLVDCMRQQGYEFITRGPD